MAEVVWTEPALSDLDAIADYIALDNPEAAALLVRRIFAHVGQLADRPRSGPKLPELKGWRYRQIVEPSCRVIYRHDEAHVLILHVVRGSGKSKKKRGLKNRSRRLGKHEAQSAKGHRNDHR